MFNLFYYLCGTFYFFQLFVKRRVLKLWKKQFGLFQDYIFILYFPPKQPPKKCGDNNKYDKHRLLCFSIEYINYFCSLLHHHKILCVISATAHEKAMDEQWSIWLKNEFLSFALITRKCNVVWTILCLEPFLYYISYISVLTFIDISSLAFIQSL